MGGGKRKKARKERRKSIYVHMHTWRGMGTHREHTETYRDTETHKTTGSTGAASCSLEF